MLFLTDIVPMCLALWQVTCTGAYIERSTSSPTPSLRHRPCLASEDWRFTQSDVCPCGFHIELQDFLTVL